MTLPGYEPYRIAAPPSRGIGITALVLGILSLPTLLLCGLGAVVGLAGLVVGVIALIRRNGRGLAIAGMAMSAASVVLGAIAVSWFLSQAAECGDTLKYPDTPARERCIEHKFPFAERSAGR
jgi:hypothetical protein